jgi:DNA-binding NarL/FixJ family response regulator
MTRGIRTEMVDTSMRDSEVVAREQRARQRLLIADHHTLLCEAIAASAAAEGYSDVRTAVDDLDVLEIVEVWRPTLILIELQLAARDGFALLRSIQRDAPGAAIVLMGRAEDLPELIVEGFLRGAVGMVSKDRGVASLVRVLHAVCAGEAAIPRHLARVILDTMRQGPALPRADVAGLSQRQRDVLALVAEGLTDRDISERLHISMPTVRSHLEAIFERTGTSNRTAAARWAHQYLRSSAGAPSAADDALLLAAAD